MHHIKRSSLLTGMSLVLLFLLAACQAGGNALTLKIVSGSENSTLEPIVKQWAADKGYNVEITYLGSLDIARMLQTGQLDYDAVWPCAGYTIHPYERTNALIMQLHENTHGGARRARSGFEWCQHPDVVLQVLRGCAG